MVKKIAPLLILIGFLVWGYWSFLGPVGTKSDTRIFIVPKNNKPFDVVGALTKGRYIKNERTFEFFKKVFLLGDVKSGGYTLSGSMNAWTILKKLNGEPDLVWVSYSSCLRKEQIGEILKENLGWNDAELDKWNTVYTNTKPEYAEGVYYPDTYLIPRNESGDKVAARLIGRFNEKFAPYAQKYIAANIRWVTGLKIASLIAREAAGEEDMHLISGIIWNRLDKGMPLQLDATMQYTLGKNKEGQWWGSIDLKEKTSDSPYNSYLYKGLPPTPICSANISYIEAALNPTETDCLFYLHDSKQQIHCAKTYEEHLENIEIYLN